MPETIAPSDGPEDDPLDDEKVDALYLKYCFEGAASLAELTRALRSLAKDLDQRAVSGWGLAEAVEAGGGSSCDMTGEGDRGDLCLV